MRDLAKHKSSVLLSLRSQVKKWELEFERTVCSPLCTKHLAALAHKGSFGTTLKQHL